ncbi:MAG: hypothetical protein HZC47_06665 [Methanobacterium sp.]|uniref:hypothetical protein n=1 Tax=Methanobacterium sp. TaxID=2164 RepID=UPI003D65A2A8|nr:hypothetical protein [Methanobacterium sp.]
MLILSVLTISGCSSSDDKFSKDRSSPDFIDQLVPIALEYNKSKGPDNSNIPIKGKLYFWDMTNNGPFTPNNFDKIENTVTYNINESDQITVFMIVNVKKKSLGNYQSYIKGVPETSKTVTGYRYYTDIIVMYWPEKTVVGWHRVTGADPTGENYIQGDAGIVYGYDLIYEWISSLPRT